MRSYGYTLQFLSVRSRSTVFFRELQSASCHVEHEIGTGIKSQDCARMQICADEQALFEFAFWSIFFFKTLTLTLKTLYQATLMQDCVFYIGYKMYETKAATSYPLANNTVINNLTSLKPCTVGHMTFIKYNAFCNFPKQNKNHIIMLNWASCSSYPKTTTKHMIRIVPRLTNH